MRIPVPKLIGFVRRFHKGINRETYKDAHREFQEELLDSGILDPKVFKEVEYFYRGQYQTSISRSPFFNVNELLFNDICEVILNEEQEKYLRDLKDNAQSDKYCFVTEEQILTCGLDKEKHIKAFIMENAFKITDDSLRVLKRRPSSKKIVYYTMDFSNYKKPE